MYHEPRLFFFSWLLVYKLRKIPNSFACLRWSCDSLSILSLPFSPQTPVVVTIIIMPWVAHSNCYYFQMLLPIGQLVSPFLQRNMYTTCSLSMGLWWKLSRLQFLLCNITEMVVLMVMLCAQMLRGSISFVAYRPVILTFSATSLLSLVSDD